MPEVVAESCPGHIVDRRAPSLAPTGSPPRIPTATLNCLRPQLLIAVRVSSPTHINVPRMLIELM